MFSSPFEKQRRSAYLALADFLRNKYGNYFYFYTTRNIRSTASSSAVNNINAFRRDSTASISTIQELKTIDKTNLV